MTFDLLPYGVLIALPLALVAWCLYKLFTGPFTPLQMLFYWAALALTRFLWRTRIEGGPLPLAPGEGAVVVANHRSSVDPFFLQTITHQKMHWLVAKEYFANPVFGFFLRTVEAIPTNRAGIDTAAIRQSIRYAERGEAIGMLPEGRINMTEQVLLPARPGAALVALKARVPIIPCYIDGAPFRRTPWSPFFMPARVIVRIGRPLDLTSYFSRDGESSVLQEITLRFMKELARLAGHTDFEPHLAGRNWKPTQEQIDADVAAAERRREAP